MKEDAGKSSSPKQRIWDKVTFLRKIQVWPLKERIDYEGWLKNFKQPNDLLIAYQLLDFFTFLSTQMVDQIFISALKSIPKKYPDAPVDILNNSVFSHIPGESSHSTDSGHLFARKVRDKLGISEDRIMFFNELGSRIKKKGQAIILIDDFVGTGTQCRNAFNQKYGQPRKKFTEFLKSCNSKVYFVPAILNERSYTKIQGLYDNLRICPGITLGQEYSILDEKCICWQNAPDLYHPAIEMIDRLSDKYGMSGDPNHPNYKYGYGSQALALAFEHGVPDATLPLFHWTQNGWKPLIKL